MTTEVFVFVNRRPSFIITMSSPTIKNRKAYHDYSIEETFDAGIALQGTEVKSIRQGNASFTDSYAFIRDGEVWLKEFISSRLNMVLTIIMIRDENESSYSTKKKFVNLKRVHSRKEILLFR